MVSIPFNQPQAMWSSSSAWTSATRSQIAHTGLSAIGAPQIVTLSINVGSSSGARELLTRFDTGHFCRIFSGAGLSNSRPLSVATKAKPNQRLCAAQSSHQTPTNLPKSVTWNRRHMRRECNSLEYFLMMVATVSALIFQLPDTSQKYYLP
jgi:hypothetical protein